MGCSYSNDGGITMTLIFKHAQTIWINSKAQTELGSLETCGYVISLAELQMNQFN